MATYETKLMEAWRRVQFCEDELVGALHEFNMVLADRPEPRKAVPAFHSPSYANCCDNPHPHNHVKLVPFVPGDGAHAFMKEIKVP